MKEASYLKKGKTYLFYQSLSHKHKPLINFYELDEEITLEELKEMNQGFSGGYVAIDNKGFVDFWDPGHLGMHIDLVQLDLYRELKKNKFSNLEFV